MTSYKCMLCLFKSSIQEAISYILLDLVILLLSYYLLDLIHFQWSRNVEAVYNNKVLIAVTSLDSYVHEYFVTW